MAYFKVENGVLIPARRGIEINTAEYKVQIDSQRYQVSANEQHSKFLIDFGMSQHKRSTIICDNAGEMLHALALVRTALGSDKKVKVK